MKSETISLAIVGTAGRGDDGYRLAKDPYHYLTTMYRAAKKVIELTGATTLVSGGAGWADACAVTLFLRDQVEEGPDEDCLRLRLELPAPMQDQGRGYRFIEGPLENAKFDAGRISNHYHNKFTAAAGSCFKEGWSSLDDLKEAISHPNCEVNHGGGFKARNEKVATATHLLAMTFGNGKEVKDGGTAHTVGQFLRLHSAAGGGFGDAYHLDLNTGKLYKGATASPEALRPYRKPFVIPRAVLDKF